ncbi:DUF1801 domain-containing protein [Winogradskyella poriferorum]|uniref:DUF1801 domain-containing protein n=1 Tax=Winogradskyella poriferorum TaxID=307627 RepID=UPI003D64D83F
MNKLNKEVSEFLDGLNHPLRDEIENLRHIITNATNGLTENIKWNGPNYCYNDNDRITMKIQPPKQIQLIFHRGAKKQEQPEDRIIQSKSKLLLWKENDRAIITFKNRFEIEKAKADLSSIVNEWILRAK